MNLDNTDIRILQEFNKLNEDEELTHWHMMRKIYPRGRSKQNNMLRHRLRKMEEMGLFLITKNSPESFSMISENVMFKKYKFPRRKKESDALFLNVNNLWRIEELP